MPCKMTKREREDGKEGLFVCAMNLKVVPGTYSVGSNYRLPGDCLTPLPSFRNCPSSLSLSLFRPRVPYNCRQLLETTVILCLEETTILLATCKNFSTQDSCNRNLNRPVPFFIFIHVYIFFLHLYKFLLHFIAYFRFFIILIEIFRNLNQDSLSFYLNTHI